MKRSFKKFEAHLLAIGLYDEIEARAAKAHVSLRELYDGPNKAPSIAAARRAVYLWLMKEGKGNNEIARIFDRAPGGVSALMRGKP